jgi:hypothetical protein
MDNFRIAVDVSASFGTEHFEGIERAVHPCLIHNALLHPPQITLEVKSQPLVAA